MSAKSRLLSLVVLCLSCTMTAMGLAQGATVAAPAASPNAPSPAASALAPSPPPAGVPVSNAAAPAPAAATNPAGLPPSSSSSAGTTASLPYVPQSTPPAGGAPLPHTAANNGSHQINLWREPAQPEPTIRLGGRVETEEERDLPHAGLYARFTAGFGVGHIGNGDLPPKPGFKPIYGLGHTSPVLSVAGQVGAGAENFALAAELLYEQMLTRVEHPSPVGFQIVALGLAGSYYTEHDWFATGHLRWVGLLYRMSDCKCFFDQLDSTWGPGVGITLGKEWFSRLSSEYSSHEQWRRSRRRHSSIGLAVQGNYARFVYAPKLEYYSGLVLLTLSHF
jgi:hypothetical protein